MPGKLLSVVQRQRVYNITFERQIDRTRYLPACPALDRIGIQVIALAINQRYQIAAHTMHRITLPISQALAAFDLFRALGNRHAITQLPSPVVASIAFSIELAAMPQVQIKRATATLLSGDEAINPLMTYRVIGLLLLQSLSNLFRAHAVIQSDRKTLTKPYNRLAKLACLRSPGVTFDRRHIGVVRQPRAVAANFSTDGRRTHAKLFGNAGLVFFTS
jgi:hypothetical protein